MVHVCPFLKKIKQHLKNTIYPNPFSRPNSKRYKYNYSNATNYIITDTVEELNHEKEAQINKIHIRSI